MVQWFNGFNSRTHVLDRPDYAGQGVVVGIAQGAMKRQGEAKRQGRFLIETKRQRRGEITWESERRHSNGRTKEQNKQPQTPGKGPGSARKARATMIHK